MATSKDEVKTDSEVKLVSAQNPNFNLPLNTGPTADLVQRLRKVQAELKAPKGQFNSFGKYKYRSCEDILEAVKPLLDENGLILIIQDRIIPVGDRFYVEATATVYSEDGSSLSATALAREESEKKGMDSAQLTGATSSYARKYCLNGLLLIDDTKDPDTEANATEANARSNGAPFGGSQTAKTFGRGNI